MMAILAVSLKARGMLKDDTLVATVMSNLGLRVAMAEQGITMIETAVGDRYVLEALNEHGLSPRRRAVGPHHLHRRTRRPATAS